MKFIVSLSLLACSVSLHAQDAIYKKDKTKLDAKVTEVGNWEVKYKSASNPDGPVYTIPKSDIAIIIYQNGSSDLFTNEKSKRCKKFDSLSTNFCRNFIGVDIGEFTNTAINITYEHTFGKKGNVALRLPFSVGLSSNNYYYYGHRKIFSTGLDLLFFPTGQGKLRYYVAPYFEWGLYNNSYTFYTYEGNYYNTQYYRSRGFSFAGGVKNGILFQATRHFSVTADLGFGIKSDPGNNSYEYIQPCSRANVILGYRF